MTREWWLERIETLQQIVDGSDIETDVHKAAFEELKEVQRQYLEWERFESNKEAAENNLYLEEARLHLQDKNGRRDMIKAGASLGVTSVLTWVVLNFEKVGNVTSKVWNTISNGFRIRL